MSEFSNKVSELGQAYGSYTALANAAGLHHTIVSRLAKGKNPPDPETLRKLCTSVSDAEATQLLIAYLTDIIPEGCRDLIKVEQRQTPRTTDAAASFGENLSKLKPTVRQALQHLSYLCIEDDDFAEYIRRSVHFWDHEWAESLLQEVWKSAPKGSRAAPERPEGASPA